MKSLKKIFFGIALPLALLSSTLPNIASAETQTGTLPNHTPAPNLQECQTGSTSDGSATLKYQEVPHWNLGFVILNIPIGTSGYTCMYANGSDNYELLYNSAGQYVGGIDLNNSNKGFSVAGDYSGKSIDSQRLDEINSANKCTLDSFNFQDCLWFPLMSWLGSWFLTLGGVMLRLAGALFDILMYHVVVAFGDTVNNQLPLSGPINVGWSVFRDVANIAIIGMFVFIAINIILGLKEYGQKKLVARVIVVAVLINFSLLFTKMIIDFSNFTAFQFYKASSQTAGIDTANFDIAKAFLDPMGITNVWKDTNALTSAAGTQTNTSGTNSNGSAPATTTSGWTAFFYGLVGGIMLGGIAAVLIYGCFHIAARAIALIFLMVTASIAFASYLVPKFSDGDYGWKAWWGALINASVFAPLLMIFLFISLQILQKAGTVVGKGTLHAFIDNPSNATSTTSGAWQSIFIYIIVVGLLYASVKIASHFSSKMGGSLISGALNIAGAVATGGVGLLAGRVVAPLARNYIGGPASRRGERLTAEGKEASRLQSLAERSYDIHKDLNPEIAAQARRRADEQKRLAGLRGRQARRMETVAGSRMNVMDTRPAKALTKRFGLKGALSGVSGKKTESYAAAAKAASIAAAKVTESIRPDTEMLRINEERRKRSELEGRKATIGAQMDAARMTLAGQKQAETDAERQRDKFQREREDKLIDAARGKGGYDTKDHAEVADIGKRDAAGEAWKEELRKFMDSVDPAKRPDLEKNIRTAASADDLKSLHQQIVEAVADPALRSTVEKQLKESTGSHESDMRHEAKRIEDARSRILEKAERGIGGVDKTEYDTTKANLDTLNSDLSSKRATAQATARQVAGFENEYRKLSADEINEQVSKAGRAVVAAVDAAMPDIAREVAMQSRSVWKKILGVETGFDTDVATATVGALKRRAESKRALDVLNAAREAERAEGATPPSTTGPGTSAPTT